MKERIVEIFLVLTIIFIMFTACNKANTITQETTIDETVTIILNDCMQGKVFRYETGVNYIMLDTIDIIVFYIDTNVVGYSDTIYTGIISTTKLIRTTRLDTIKVIDTKNESASSCLNRWRKNILNKGEIK